MHELIFNAKGAETSKTNNNNDGQQMYEGAGEEARGEGVGVTMGI